MTITTAAKTKRALLRKELKIKPPMGTNICLPVFALLVLLSAIGVIAAQSSATISLSPLILAAGQTGVIEARIDCGSVQCSGYEIVIEFDPSVVRVDENVEFGSYLGDIGETLILQNRVNNTSGTIQLAAVSIGSPSVPSDNLLFSLNITGLEVGEAHFRIALPKLSDFVGAPVSVVGISGRTSVIPQTTETVNRPRATINGAADVRSQPITTLQPTPTSILPAVPSVVVIVPSANLRRGPAIEFGVVHVVEQGARLEVVARTPNLVNPWYLVLTPDGDRAWIASSTVELDPDIGLQSIEIAATIPAIPATATPDARPVIAAASIEGSCSATHVYVVVWSDPNGDAARIDYLSAQDGSVWASFGLSGGGGTHRSPNYGCSTGNCGLRFVVVDYANNQSNVAYASCPR